jgi:hypothetical protein
VEEEARRLATAVAEAADVGAGGERAEEGGAGRARRRWIPFGLLRFESASVMVSQPPPPRRRCRRCRAHRSGGGGALPARAGPYRPPRLCPVQCAVAQPGQRP